MTSRWKDPHWQFSFMVFAIVAAFVFTILCSPVCRGGKPAGKPVLMIDHNAYSKASRDLLAEYKRDGSTLAPWLRERYTIRWRCSWPTPDLPRFWRNGRLLGNGWAGEQRLRLLLGDVTPSAIASPATVTVIDSQVSGLRSSLASVESRFEQADQNFTDELTALGEQLGTQFSVVDTRLAEAERRITATTDRNLVTVRERREYKKSFDSVKQKQTENTTLIGTLTAKVGERINHATPDGLWGLGSAVTKGLAIAGVVGTGGLGGGLGGWLLLTAGRVLLRKVRGEPDGEGDRGEEMASRVCLECRVNRATIESLRKQVSQLEERRKRPPISDRIRDNLSASESEIRSLQIEVKTLTAELKKCRDRPQPTSADSTLADDVERLHSQRDGGREGGTSPAPFPRHLDEARELLKLRQSEGRVGLLDALRGMFLDDRAAHIRDNGTPAEQAVVNNLISDIDKRVNEVAPYTTQPKE